MGHLDISNISHFEEILLYLVQQSCADKFTKKRPAQKSARQPLFVIKSQ